LTLLQHMRRVSGSTALLALGLGACSGRDKEPTPLAGGDLPDGVVSLVAEEPILEATVARIAQYRHIAPAQALDLAISDALLARGAASLAPLLRRAAASRALLDQFRAEAVAQGLPGQEELELAKEHRWWELDRPEMRRVVHVVVVVEDNTDRVAAKARAELIYQAAKDAPNGVTFRERVNSVDQTGFKITLQDLLPVALDGRALDVERYQAPGTSAQQYHVEFARPIFELSALNQITPLFESPSGYHVAMLLQIIPELRLAPDELKKALSEDIYDGRARGIIKTFLDEAKQRMKPEHALDAPTLTALTLPSPSVTPTAPTPER
jgi:hypothetical protein